MRTPEASVLIRRAGLQDAAEVAWILRQSFIEYQDRYTPEGFAATTPDEQRVSSRMGEGPTWVALVGNAIVGTASVVQKGEDGLYVRGMAVLPSARGRRVGKLLLREIEGFALRNGCTRLLLSTTPFLSDAIRLYQRFGFKRTNDGPNELFGTPLFSMAKALNGERDSEEVTRKEDPCRKTTDTPPAFA
ncbi:MAG: GNAT family N-acetyltransferase [Terriglobales bacterium]